MNYVSSLKEYSMIKIAAYKILIAALLALKIYAIVLMIEAIWINPLMWLAVISIIIGTILIRYAIEPLQITREVEWKGESIRPVFRSLFLTIRKKDILLCDIKEVKRAQEKKFSFSPGLRNYRYKVVTEKKQFILYLDDYIIFLLSESGVNTNDLF